MVLDLIVIVMFITTTLRGKIRGFSDSLIRLAGLVAALVLGALFTEDVSTLLTATPLDDFISENLRSLSHSNTVSISDFVPQVIAKAISTLGTEHTTHTIAHVTNVTMMVFSFLLIVLSVWTISVILRKKMEKNRREKTVIGSVDSGVGLLFGMIKGALYVFLFLAFLFPLANIFLPGHVAAINNSLDNSFIAGFLYDINPLIYFIKKLPL